MTATRKTYVGERRFSGAPEVRVVCSEPGRLRDSYPLPLLAGQPGMPNHSPTGHEWAYGGSGPAQLAHDLLHDLLGKSPSPALYHGVKWKVIARLSHAQWQLTDEEVLAAVAAVEDGDETQQ